MASAVGSLMFLITSPLIYHRYALVPIGVGMAMADLARWASLACDDVRAMSVTPVRGVR